MGKNKALMDMININSAGEYGGAKTVKGKLVTALSKMKKGSQLESDAHDTGVAAGHGATTQYTKKKGSPTITATPISGNTAAPKAAASKAPTLRDYAEKAGATFADGGQGAMTVAPAETTAPAEKKAPKKGKNFGKLMDKVKKKAKTTRETAGY